MKKKMNKQIAETVQRDYLKFRFYLATYTATNETCKKTRKKTTHNCDKE